MRFGAPLAAGLGAAWTEPDGLAAAAEGLASAEVAGLAAAEADGLADEAAGATELATGEADGTAPPQPARRTAALSHVAARETSLWTVGKGCLKPASLYHGHPLPNGGDLCPKSFDACSQAGLCSV